MAEKVGISPEKLRPIPPEELEKFKKNLNEAMKHFAQELVEKKLISEQDGANFANATDIEGFMIFVRLQNESHKTVTTTLGGGTAGDIFMFIENMVLKNVVKECINPMAILKAIMPPMPPQANQEPQKPGEPAA